MSFERNVSTRSPSIDIFDFDTETTSTLLQLDEGDRAAEFAISADGQWIYFSQLNNWGSDIMLVENFSP